MNNIHREGNVQDGDTVRNLDRIDADLDGRDVDFVKCSRAAIQYTLFPSQNVAQNLAQVMFGVLGHVKP